MMMKLGLWWISNGGHFIMPENAWTVEKWFPQQEKRSKSNQLGIIGGGKCIWLLCFLQDSLEGRFAGVFSSADDFHVYWSVDIFIYLEAQVFISTDYMPLHLFALALHSVNIIFKKYSLFLFFWTLDKIMGPKLDFIEGLSAEWFGHNKFAFVLDRKLSNSKQLKGK